MLSIVVSCSSENDSGIERSPVPPPLDHQSRSAESRSKDPRSSVVLVVIDTLRADAVSAYGTVEGTTPNLDALARRGIRYERAYAPAPFTASSHASLFTGLRVDQHGVGLSSASIVRDSLQMLAEDFANAGYTTVGYSENPLLGPEFGFDQGFDRYEVADLIEYVRRDQRGEDPAEVLGLLERVRVFERTRDQSRPYFLFINIIDPHDPYIVRETNQWVPEGMTTAELSRIEERHPIPRAICYRLPPDEDREVLHGLYLGDVAAADEKLGRILSVLGSPGGTDTPIVIVTSDHGEHFGEHRLMGHRFSVRTPVLKVPLIVAGLPEASPSTTIPDPVEMRSLRQSILCWSLGEECPAVLPIRPPPALRGLPDPIFSIYSDVSATTPEVHREMFGFGDGEWIPDSSRSGCKSDDLVFGKMVSMIRYPWKATWVEGHEISLNDLGWDPGERMDQAKRQPAIADDLIPELRTFVEANILDRDQSPTDEISEETIRTLKSLGYLD